MPKHKSTRSTFWRFMMLVCLSAALTHLLFFALFYTLKASILAWVNVGSVSFFIIAYFAIKQHHNWLAVLLIMSELLGHAALAIWLIGWDSDFHYYLMLVAPVVILSNIKKVQSKLLMVGSVCVFYMILDAAVRLQPPHYNLPDQVMSSLRYFNIVVTFVLLTYLAMMYFTMIKNAEKKLLAAATTDPLTNLFNRRKLSEIIEYEITHSKRDAQGPCFLLADIDHFKTINDQYGHDAGDLVLVEVSKALQHSIREQDAIGRWGGEEFLIVLPNTDIDGAQRVGERIMAALARLQICINNQPIAVTMTIGLSNYQKGEAMQTAITRADEALYRGKNAGRNRLVVNSHDHHTVLAL